jgi:hypothetical protein
LGGLNLILLLGDEELLDGSELVEECLLGAVLDEEDGGDEFIEGVILLSELHGDEGGETLLDTKTNEGDASTLVTLQHAETILKCAKIVILTI